MTGSLTAEQASAVIETLLRSASMFLPELFLSALFIAVIIIDLIIGNRNRLVVPLISLIGLGVAGVLVWQQHGLEAEQMFLGMYAIDAFAIFFKYLFIASGILAIVISLDAEELTATNAPTDEPRGLGEYYAILVAMVLGMFLMASATDLLMMYLSLELVSIASYVLTGYLKGQVRSSEAALKYIIYGAVSSGLMIYGISILYGLTGHTNIFAINNFLQQNTVDTITLLLSALLIMGGFGYKIGAVPFHFWSPDVYEGAPTPVTAFLSVGSKAAGFAMLIRFFRVTIPEGAGAAGAVPDDVIALNWVGLLSFIAVISMTLGNVVAIWQTSVKRLLAYSSIAHAGYILLGVLVSNELGTQAVLFYLASYTIMNVGAFFVVVLIANKTGSDDVNDYKGIGKRMPLAAAALTIFLVSLTGLPPTVGFIGKYLIFAALLGKGTGFIWLAVIGVLNSVISLYYYFKIPLNMYLRESESGNTSPLDFGVLSNAIVAFLMIITVVLGFYISPLFTLTKDSVSILGAIVK